MVVRLFCGQARRLFALLLGLLVLLLVGTAQAAEKEYYYATDALNLRQGPGMTHGVKGEVALGERVALLGLEGKWAKIQTAQGTTGYVFSAYLAPSGDTAAAYYAATDLNLRAGPGMSHEVVGELLEGETVKRLHTVGNWALVEGEKGIGYAFTRYLSIRTPAQPAAGCASPPWRMPAPCTGTRLAPSTWTSYNIITPQSSGWWCWRTWGT